MMMSQTRFFIIRFRRKGKKIDYLARSSDKFAAICFSIENMVQVDFKVLVSDEWIELIMGAKLQSKSLLA